MDAKVAINESQDFGLGNLVAHAHRLLENRRIHIAIIRDHDNFLRQLRHQIFDEQSNREPTTNMHHIVILQSRQ